MGIENTSGEKNLVYFGISKSNRKNFDQEIRIIEDSLKRRNYELLVFVDKYNFELGQENEMMRIAFEEIDRSKIMITELSKKAIGVGIEIGYAKAKNIPIIYIKKEGEKYSTTAGGCANHIIEYAGAEDLRTQLEKIMEQMNV
ncbi:hypothetical protein FUAX_39780 (plasmid) [Fulvitalea axinellae]|uniref:Nucleoside 2-deoxyribosyltransferase n=1 Tax=Fulvitalea axinellae TaxID=1182444 RepID=A0AAU9DEA1_9BACT|nr:hypothetical protein FUAX_39780 [Fulvitalea axinellae]